ncbi:MAG: hypothetical protein M1830_009798 [Pleopsidium flavum]|nr:MAG: hypothetical protein M1830_009798 [Pleopsidium flavum]
MGMMEVSTIQRLARRAATLTYGIITLLFFVFLAFRDGSLFKQATEKEKNNIALAQDKLWNLSKDPHGLNHAFYKLANGFRLHYVSITSSLIARKNLIIFLHGFPDSWALWRPLLDSSGLRSNSALVAVDLPGYGGSDSLKEYGATDVLEAVAEFVIGMRELCGVDREDDMEGTGIRTRVIIVGHDWGCIIGSRLATEAPQLADRFILSNAPHPPLLIANVESLVSSSSKMLTTFVHHPLISRSLLRKALFTFAPLLDQIRKSGYAFTFNLPLPLVALAGSMGNFWFLRTCHRIAAGKDHPFQSQNAAEAMASSQGPGAHDLRSLTDSHESYPQSVARRASSGGFTEKIRYYREGLFSNPWIKTLETLATLHAIGESGRSGSGAGLLDDEPKGSLKAKTTIVWGLMDQAVDQRLALQGIGEYMPRGSQVVVLPNTGHWTPNEGAGSRAFAKVLEWAAGGEEGDLGHMVQKVYDGARITIQK